LSTVSPLIFKTGHISCQGEAALAQQFHYPRQVIPLYAHQPAALLNLGAEQWADLFVGLQIAQYRF